MNSIVGTIFNEYFTLKKKRFVNFINSAWDLLIDTNAQYKR